MKINIDNYEEYFLLYADKELPAHEINMVNEFVKEHPELEEEFLAIRQSVLPAENDLTLDDKNGLFRKTKELINTNNYEEVFILYNDNELGLHHRVEAEAFLTENPSLQNQFTLLQKTKLQPDLSVVFPGKNSLLKKEATKVIPLRLWKLAVAATLVAAVILAGVDFSNKKSTTLPETVNTNLPVKKSKEKQIDIIGAKNKNVVAEKILPVPAKEKLVMHARKENIEPKNLHEPANTVSNSQQSNDLPLPEIVKDKIEDKAPALALDEADEKIDEKIITDEIKTGDKNVIPGAMVSYQDDESNNNYAFYNISSERFSKTKVGSFFKKVKRIIGRKISPLSNSKNEREVAVN